MVGLFENKKQSYISVFLFLRDYIIVFFWRESAVQGHANLLMATRYVQDVSKQTDDVVEKSRIYVI